MKGKMFSENAEESTEKVSKNCEINVERGEKQGYK